MTARDGYVRRLLDTAPPLSVGQRDVLGRLLPPVVGQPVSVAVAGVEPFGGW